MYSNKKLQSLQDLMDSKGLIKRRGAITGSDAAIEAELTEEEEEEELWELLFILSWTQSHALFGEIWGFCKELKKKKREDQGEEGLRWWEGLIVFRVWFSLFKTTEDKKKWGRKLKLNG